jgi:hypothetical protein
MGILRSLVEVDHTVQVTSFGGTGTTMLYDVLEEHDVDVPSDKQPWKHRPRPLEERTVPPGFRAIYLFGNPMNAVLSVFRRGYQRWHFRNMTGDFDGWNEELSCLDGFLRRDTDPFRMEEHFENWMQADRSYPILLLRFDTMWAHLPELFAFVGLPTRLIDSFPEKRERHSVWQNEEERVQNQLRRMYGDFAERIDRFPDWKVI